MCGGGSSSLQEEEKWKYVKGHNVIATGEKTKEEKYIIREYMCVVYKVGHSSHIPAGYWEAVE